MILLVTLALDPPHVGVAQEYGDSPMKVESFAEPGQWLVDVPEPVGEAERQGVTPKRG